MHKIELSNTAETDIMDIASYTRRRYGAEQVKKYTSMLFQQMKLLAQVPQAGHMRTDLPEGYKAKNAGEHIIVYTEQQGTIYVARILHGSMDFENQDIPE
jgi:toxin ParE1/3/4